MARLLTERQIAAAPLAFAPRVRLGRRSSSSKRLTPPLQCPQTSHPCRHPSPRAGPEPPDASPRGGGFRAGSGCPPAAQLGAQSGWQGSFPFPPAGERTPLEDPTGRKAASSNFRFFHATGATLATATPGRRPRPRRPPAEPTLPSRGCPGSSLSPRRRPRAGAEEPPATHGLTAGRHGGRRDGGSTPHGRRPLRRTDPSPPRS